MKAIGYQLCECPEHGTVCAKVLAEREGGGEVNTYRQCPGVRGDTGGCNEMLTPMGGRCERPSWAEYPSDRW